MIIVDTTTLVAILRDEPERRQFTKRIEAAERCFMSAASLLQTRIVLCARRGNSAIVSLHSLISEIGVDVVDVTKETAEIAFAAFREFGKATGSPAGLNFSDCFSYAPAKELDLALLFKGRNFAQTDIVAATEQRV